MSINSAPVPSKLGISTGSLYSAIVPLEFLVTRAIVFTNGTLLS